MTKWNYDTQKWEDDVIDTGFTHPAPEQALTGTTVAGPKPVPVPSANPTLVSPEPQPAHNTGQEPKPIGAPSLAPSGMTDEPKSAEPLTFTAPIQEVATSTQEPTIEENASMIRQAFDKIMSKAVEATDLAKRVGELEKLCNSMEAQLHDLANELAGEKRNHEDTQKRLQEVQTQLAQRESTVHDLVKERDDVFEARNHWQQVANGAQADRQEWEKIAKEFEDQLNREKHRCHILEERCNTMTQRVNALKEAFGALHSI